MACRIFHGPGGRSSALADARERGHLLRDPVGEDGLKVDESREIVELLLMPPPGSRKGSLVLGPMDQAQPAASDALLKTVEDLDHSLFVLNLWALDVGEVMPTIQSRCEAVWCPTRTEHDPQPGEGVYDVALSLVDAYRKGDPVTVLEVLKDRQEQVEILRTVPEVLAVDLLAGRSSASDVRLWMRLRKVLTHVNLSKTEVAAALMPEAVA